MAAEMVGEVQIPMGYHHEPDRPGECYFGHVGFWCYRQRGKARDWVCGFRGDVLGKARWCRWKETDGQPMGFLNGRESAAPYVVKDWILQSICRHQVATGEAVTIVDIRTYAPALSDGQINGALGRSVQTQHLINLGKKLLPIHGSAFSYGLTWRGMSYLIAKRLASQEDIDILVTYGSESNNDGASK